MDGQPELNLHVLGELTATRDGAVVDLGGRRQRAVLAALAIQRDQVVTGGPPRRLRLGRPRARQRERRAAGVRQPPPPTARARRDGAPAGRSHRPCRAGLRATTGTGSRGRVGVRGRGRVGRRASAGGRGVHARDRVADVARTGVRRLRGGGVGRGGGRPAHRAARGRPRAAPRDAARARRGTARHRRPRGAGQGGPAARGAVAAADARALPLPPPGSRARGAAPGTDGARRRARRRPGSRAACPRGGGARPVARPRRTETRSDDRPQRR